MAGLTLRRRSKSAFLLVAALLAAYAVLAVLQYRWIQEVAEADLQRMRNTIEVATSRFAEEFDGEVSRALMALALGQIPPAPEGYGELYLQWRAAAAYPKVVKNVFIAQQEDRGSLQLLQFDLAAKRLIPVDWPSRLEDVKAQLRNEWTEGPIQFPPAELQTDIYLAREPPTAVIPLPHVIALSGPGPAITEFAAPVFEQPEPPNWMVVEFDAELIAKEVFPDLFHRYFSNLGAGEYRLVVRTTNEPRQIIYQSDPSRAPGNITAPDAHGALFSFRALRLPPVTERAGLRLRGVRRIFTRQAPPPRGHWELLVEHRLGSVDAAVNQLRRRNLAVSFGILLVLVGSVVMIIIASERARVLAKLQMQFAAGVSHELRTPLAVIQALMQNITTGIVKDSVHVREYAGMVQDEARGLGSMVDQVLLFAESRSIQKRYAVGPVEVVEVVDRALATLTSQIRESGCSIVNDIPDDLPRLRANAVSLTHCVRNLISNALKYGRSPKNIVLVKAAVRPSGEVALSIGDDGPGIDPVDWPHLFEPFYRGRSVGPGTRGAGLGLYLVKHLIEAQGGRVTVETRRQAGTTFTLHILVFDDELRHVAPATSG